MDRQAFSMNIRLLFIYLLVFTLPVQAVPLSEYLLNQKAEKGFALEDYETALEKFMQAKDYAQ